MTICDIVEVGGIKHIKGARPIRHNALPDDGEILIKNVIEQKTKGTRKFVSQDHRMKFADYLQSLKSEDGTLPDNISSDVGDSDVKSIADDINNVDVDVSDDGEF